MKAEAVTAIHNATKNVAILAGGWVLVYLACWLIESGPVVERWSAARAAWSVMGSFLAWGFQHHLKSASA